MILTDRIHGTHDIQEPVLLALLSSKPVQRLKNINQYGCTQLITPGATVTRYEHSVGVMLLLRKLGASVEEQAAGLLHDASHTAFSHVADYVMGSTEQTYHEEVFDEVVGNSEIPEILRMHGLDPQRVFNTRNYGLLERDAPDLCADRVDYGLRDHSRRVPGMDGPQLAQHLGVYNEMIVFTDAGAAEEFALEYLRLDKEFWASPREAAAMQILSLAIRAALDTGCLQENDLFLTDDEVLERLRNCSQNAVQEPLRLLTPEFAVKTCDPEDADLHVQVKCRTVNPPVLVNESIVRVSEISEVFVATSKEHDRWCQLGHNVRIVGN